MVELFGTLYLSEVGSYNISYPTSHLSTFLSQYLPISTCSKGLEKEAAVERAMKIFATLDIDNDGDVTEEEFVQGCLKDEELVMMMVIVTMTKINNDIRRLRL